MQKYPKLKRFFEKAVCISQQHNYHGTQGHMWAIQLNNRHTPAIDYTECSIYNSKNVCAVQNDNTES